jgi:hypothetical protein
VVEDELRVRDDPGRLRRLVEPGEATYLPVPKASFVAVGKNVSRLMTIADFDERRGR